MKYYTQKIDGDQKLVEKYLNLETEIISLFS